MGGQVKMGHTTSNLQVGIVGCGLIGRKRAVALNALEGARLTWCADIDERRANDVASIPRSRAEVTSDWASLVEKSDVDVVFVSATNELLSVITEAAVRAGKHVLVEKPGAIRAEEASRLAALAESKGVFVRVGFNHRFHPALQKAMGLVSSGAVGDLMFIRGRYGHGGRVGYDREWRADPRRSGGGELIDQGVHLIDLARWFLGELTEVDGHAATYFWDMPVDDNAFLNLRTATGQTAFMHVSCTEWKNLFSFEIYGRTGKLHVEGLGGSYGVERLAFYKMLPEMGPPETTMWEYPRGDESWALEVRELLEDVRLDRPPRPGLTDAAKALGIVETIYRRSGYDHHS